MSDEILWIADHDAEFLIGADGYPYECFDKDGNAVVLYNIVDDQEISSTPGSVTRLLVVMDSNNRMWGAPWYSVANGTPGFTWDQAPTVGRRSESRAKFAQWVGFRPVSIVEVTTTEYAIIGETS